jgi:hypothetical protein
MNEEGPIGQVVDQAYAAGHADGRAEALRPVLALAEAWDDPAWRGHDTAAPFARALRAACEGDRP